MSLNILQNFQTLCNIIIFLGVIAMASGTLGNFYFAKKITEKKDQVASEEKSQLNKKIESLLKGNDELKTELQPFKDIAKEKFPNEDIRAALNKLTDELHDINKKTERTIFKIEDFKEDNTPSGEYEVKMLLKPIGENVIPIFTIVVKTQNSAVIKKFEAKGATVPGMSYDRISKDRTSMSKEYRTMRPGEIFITIITDKDPGRMSVSIDPS